MGRRQSDTKQWKVAYEDYQKSGTTQSEYCAKIGVSLSRFKIGIRLAREAGVIAESERSQARNGNKKDTNFLAVEVANEKADKDPEIKTPYCELLINGQSGLRIENIDAMGFLINIIRELRLSV